MKSFKIFSILIITLCFSTSDSLAQPKRGQWKPKTDEPVDKRGTNPAPIPYSPPTGSRTTSASKNSTNSELSKLSAEISRLNTELSKLMYRVEALENENRALKRKQ
jgi:hypothetical protein